MVRCMLFFDGCSCFCMTSPKCSLLCLSFLACICFSFIVVSIFFSCIVYSSFYLPNNFAITSQQEELCLFNGKQDVIHRYAMCTKLLWQVSQLPYLPVYNTHFFSAKTAPKIEMRSIHGIHCFRHASLISIKTKMHWFLIEKGLTKIH